MLLRLTLFDCTNSVFNITNENNSFSISITGHWQNKSDDIPVNELNRLLELRSQCDFDLQFEQVRKNVLILINDYSSSSFDTFRVEIFLEIKKANYYDLEHLVSRFHLTYDEIIDIVDIKYIPKKKNRI